MEEELGDLLLQVVFHCQLARERGAFDFERVARHIADKLLRRHPHVFGNLRVKNVDQVWANWEKIKRAEKHGTRTPGRLRWMAFRNIFPRSCGSRKLMKKARRAGLATGTPRSSKRTRTRVAEELFELARYANSRGWSAEDLLRSETRKRERALRKLEARRPPQGSATAESATV